MLTAIIPFEHILLKKSGKDIDSGRKKKVNFATYGTMAILLTIIVFSEYLGAYVTIFLSCFILPIFWGEKNLKLLIPYVILFPLFIILIFNIVLNVLCSLNYYMNCRYVLYFSIKYSNVGYLIYGDVL